MPPRVVGYIAVGKLMIYSKGIAALPPAPCINKKAL